MVVDVTSAYCFIVYAINVQTIHTCYSLLYISCIFAIVFIDSWNPQMKKVTLAHPPLFIHP